MKKFKKSAKKLDIVFNFFRFVFLVIFHKKMFSKLIYLAMTVAFALFLVSFGFFFIYHTEITTLI